MISVTRASQFSSIVLYTKIIEFGTKHPFVTDCSKCGGNDRDDKKSKSDEDKNKGGNEDSKNGGSAGPSKPCFTMYDARKYGHCLPCNNVMTYFEPLPCIPTGIFRCVEGERLGPCADKCGYYRNPEYFCYHHMTYYDMHHILRCCRMPSAVSGRKPKYYF